MRTATQTLADADVRTTLIDLTNHHPFQPLLYQIATAALAVPTSPLPFESCSGDRRT